MQSASRVSIPRLVVGAPHGRSGKTTAMLALVGALTTRGLVVQPFKKGPDFIDPSWLTAAAHRAARNLDSFMLSDNAMIGSVARAGHNADIVIVEGNHGLFDSHDDEGKGSTAALARLLRAPILLVVDAARMGRSVAALVSGYQRFEPDTHIAGVILNHVAQARHAAKLQSAIEKYCTIPVVGILPRDDSLKIADRHLGLIPREEYDAHTRAPLDAMRRIAEERFDLDTILRIARDASPLPPVPPSLSLDQLHQEKEMRGRYRIGIIRDAVFTFYYPENLEALEGAGAELVFVNALREESLPPVDALYIGGGFPEVFAAQLEANASLRADIHSAIENDLPVYAECGGLMYLARSIRWHSKRWEMVGALACDIEIMDTPQGHGYVQACVEKDNPFFACGDVLRGHEYHHSRVVNLDAGARLAYRLSRGRGIGDAQDGIVHRRVLAAYTHLHALGTRQWARGMVEAK